MNDNEKSIGKLSYYAMYLRQFLREIGSPLKDNDDFINERANQAEFEYEESRRGGMTVFSAQERAMYVLVKGISDL